jgi:hypothetical protein
MTAEKTDHTGRNIWRERQTEQLQQQEGKLAHLASQRKKREFLQQITPLLQPLKDYIKRRLRVAYLEMEVRTPVLHDRRSP